jgi:hypothetical protein
MNFNTFSQSLNAAMPPAELSIYLQAMWYDACNEWHKAHYLVDNINDINAYRVHAYLHRKEGDLTNAAYWYQRANITMPAITLVQEWEVIVKHLLNN